MLVFFRSMRTGVLGDFVSVWHDHPDWRVAAALGGHRHRQGISGNFVLFDGAVSWIGDAKMSWIGAGAPISLDQLGKICGLFVNWVETG